VNRTRKVIGTTAAVLLLSCNSSIDFAGIQGSGRANAVRGPITRFGSIFVNGVEYTTSGASVVIDDSPGTESQLRAGQVVTLQGLLNPDGTTGTASAVSFSGDVRGPVTQINSAGKTFVVLGQTVRVSDTTLFDDAIQPGDLTGLQTGSTVEVSGFANAAGEIVASRVDLRTAGTLQVKGTIGGLDTAAQTFRINSLLVNYGAASVTGSLKNGNDIVVQGASLTPDGQLVAAIVENAPGLGAAVNESVNISGLITDVTSLLQFVLDGQVVVIDPNTHLVLHGIPLGLNVAVDVQGTMTADGVILAKKVEVRPQGISLLGGVVESLSATTNSLTVQGVTVTTDSATTYADKSTQHVRSFNLADLHVGDYVEVRVAQTQTGTVSAATLVRRNFIPAKAVLGPVQ
jgi:hypothetical protein